MVGPCVSSRLASMMRRSEVGVAFDGTGNSGCYVMDTAWCRLLVWLLELLLLGSL